MKKNMKFTDNPDIKFKKIDLELWREYDFITDTGIVVTLKIAAPLVLHVSKSGGHRIIDSKGIAHYIPYKWIALRWDNTESAVRLQF